MNQAKRPADFKAGDTVYSLDGAEGRYVARAANGHVVESLYDNEDADEPYYADPTMWREVFTKPPTQRLHDEIAELQLQIAEETGALDALLRARDASDAEERAAAARRKAHPELMDLDLWLSGGVTHMVLVSTYGIEIAPAEDILKRRDDGSMRLVSLFGDRKNSYSWRMARYGDGSGGGDDCLLASSEEDAKRRAGEWLASQFRRGDNHYTKTALARSAIKYGLPYPEELKEKIAAEDIERAENLLKSRRDALERAQKDSDEVAGAA